MQLVSRGTGSWSPRQDGETIAIAITMPDLNQVLKKMKGRLLPLGWWHFLRKRRSLDQVRVGFLGVKPEHQHTGVAACSTWSTSTWPRERGRRRRDGLDPRVERGDEPRDGGDGRRIVKRYRVFERKLGAA